MLTAILTVAVREFTEQYPAPDGSAVEPPNKVQRRRVSLHYYFRIILSNGRT